FGVVATPNPSAGHGSTTGSPLKTPDRPGPLMPPDGAPMWRAASPPLPRALALALVVACLAVACSDRGGSPAPAPREAGTAPDADEAVGGPGYFTDVTASSGVHFLYRNGEEADLYTLLESLGGGVALLDYDRDGLLDI